MTDAIIYNLPEVWASAIVNDDWSAIDDEEVYMIENFLTNELQPNQYLVMVSDEPEFMVNHDAEPYGWLPDNCYQFQLMQ